MARIVRLAAGSAFGSVLLFGAATALHSSPAPAARDIVCGDGYCCQTEPYFYCWRTY